MLQRNVSLSSSYRVAKATFLLGISLFLPIAVPSQQESSARSTAGAAPSHAAFHGYDVITIKANKSGSGSSHWSSDPTTVLATNMSIRMLLSAATGIREALISGLPPWAESDRYDIQAKIVDPDPALKTRTMTREQSIAEYHAQVMSILQERFHVKTHTDTKEQPVYDLVVAKAGSKLQPHTAANGPAGSTNHHNDLLKAVGIRMPDLAKLLERDAGRNITDHTGLEGTYDFELRWSRDAQNLNATDNGSTDRPPDLFTALQEQLGLKLVAAKGQVDTLVVDTIDPPTLD